MASLKLQNIVKQFGQTEVIHGVSLQIEDGEFVVFVGPSGCGKSTVARIIVGLLARWFYPGAIHLGFIYTTLLGIGGSLIGGFIGGLIKRPADGQMFHPAGFIMSIIGACILLYVAHMAGMF